MSLHIATRSRFLLGIFFTLTYSSHWISANPVAPLATEYGVVASDNAVASKVGATILEQGGNAVDAAIATALSLGVVSPTSSGIGGGGFAVTYDAKTKKVRVFDFREVAPANLSPKNFYRDGKLDPNLSRTGGLAVGVPGEIAGLALMRKELGSFAWKELVSPAASIAEKGFPVSGHFANAARLVSEALGMDLQMSRWLAPKGVPLKEGARVRRSHLGKALRSIAADGPDVFYEGWIANDLVKAANDNGGVFELSDFKNYRVVEKEPLSGNFGKYKIVTMPIPSSGGLVLLAMLGMLESGGWDLPAMKPGSAQALQLLAEVLKHAFSDRARFLGGDTSEQVAVRFLNPKRLARLAKKISLGRTKKSRNYGDKRLPAYAPPKNDGGTSHLCVVDAEGNAVALTTTVNGYFGAKLIGQKTGIVLNNEIDDFALSAGGKNMFGLVQSKENVVAPRKRPLSSMTPTLVFENDRVVACAGASGGPRIISATFQSLLNALVWGMDVTSAVKAPRIHHQWLPNTLWLEDGISADVAAELEKKGHEIKEPKGITAVQMVLVGEAGRQTAASDPRKGGKAVPASKTRKK